jgi:uncharacterized protein YgiM (DUF1202 family)
MKTIFGRFLAALMAASITQAPLRAAETAIVKGDNVNVRGLPSLTGEVITQIKKGEQVVVLEEIPAQKAKTDEPAKWVRIQMPANTPVWVNATFVDTNNTVIPPKLNLRAGPGENYSVVGRVEKGHVLKPIRTVEAWIEVEGVTNAYAFVAADLLTAPSAAPAPAAVEKVAEAKPEDVKAAEAKAAADKLEAAKVAEAKAAEAKAAEAVPAAPPLVQEKVAEEPKVAPTVDAALAAPPAKPQAKPEVKTLPVAAPPAQTLTPPPVAPPLAKLEEPIPRRVVVREGIVKGMVSIQAPAYFELRSAETEKLLNYLHPMSTNIVLKKLRGKKVVVSGEEIMDVRWPSTPVINVQSLQLAP